MAEASPAVFWSLVRWVGQDPIRKIDNALPLLCPELDWAYLESRLRAPSKKALQNIQQQAAATEVGDSEVPPITEVLSGQDLHQDETLPKDLANDGPVGSRQEDAEMYLKSAETVLADAEMESPASILGPCYNTLQKSAGVGATASQSIIGLARATAFDLRNIIRDGAGNKEALQRLTEDEAQVWIDTAGSILEDRILHTLFTKAGVSVSEKLQAAGIWTLRALAEMATQSTESSPLAIIINTLKEAAEKINGRHRWLAYLPSRGKRNFGP